VDNAYDTDWVNFKETKKAEHPFQVNAVERLSDGTIAVSGGPLRFDILLYSTVYHQPSSKQSSPAEFAHVGSIDTQGLLVEHMIEFKRDFMFVVGKGNTFLVFQRH
jgi:hypothetical protein